MRALPNSEENARNAVERNFPSCKNSGTFVQNGVESKQESKTATHSFTPTAIRGQLVFDLSKLPIGN